MRVCIFASGSGGNCLLLSEGESHLLIDAGISLRRIRCGLQQAGLSMQDLCGVLITHEHSDHISGLKMLCKHHRIPLYAPAALAGELLRLLPDCREQLCPVPLGEPFCLGSLQVRACPTPHDACQSVAYRVEGEESFALATDMGHVTEEILAFLRGVDAAVIEANYDEDMLRSGPYPFFLKRRILSDRGHLSNACCAGLAAQLSQWGTGQIVLGHLSRENNRPELAYEAVAARLPGKTGLCCAPVQGFLEIQIGKREKCLL